MNPDTKPETNKTEEKELTKSEQYAKSMAQQKLKAVVTDINDLDELCIVTGCYVQEVHLKQSPDLLFSKKHTIPSNFIRLQNTDTETLYNKIVRLNSLNFGSKDVKKILPNDVFYNMCEFLTCRDLARYSIAKIILTQEEQREIFVNRAMTPVIFLRNMIDKLLATSVSFFGLEIEQTAQIEQTEQSENTSRTTAQNKNKP